MEKKPEKGLFEFLKNIIIGIVTEVANSYYYFQQHIAPFFEEYFEYFEYYFQQHIAPFFKEYFEYFEYYFSDNIDLWLFLMFVILLFTLLIIFFSVVVIIRYMQKNWDNI